MTYQEAVKGAKDIPITEPAKIREFVLRIRDNHIAMNICSKWYSIVSRGLNYIAEPAPSPMFNSMEQDIKDRNEVWRVKSKYPEVVAYMQMKRNANVLNHKLFNDLIDCLDNLHESEEAAKKEVMERIVEVLNASSKEASRPFGGYEFISSSRLEKYGIKPKRKVQDDTGVVPRKDTQGD